MVKDKLKAEALSISLTFDIWSARKNSRGYAGVTAHYIDTNFVCKQLVLDFRHLPYPHETQDLRIYLQNVLTRFGIASKLAAITTDNASNNISAIDQLKGHVPSLGEDNKFACIHMRCAAHVINLAVKSALKELKSEVSLIKSFVDATKRKEKFESIQLELIRENDSSRSADDLGFNPKKPYQLVQDIDVRWNSTFLLLERAYLSRTAVIKTSEMIPGLNACKNMIKTLYGFLKPFHIVTNKLSSANCSTVPAMIYYFPKLIQHARTYETTPLKSAAQAFTCNMSEYEALIKNETALLATVLDPTYKLTAVPEELKERLLDILKQAILTVVAEPETSTQSSIFESSSFEENDTIFGDRRRRRSTGNEVDCYLMSGLEEPNTDVFKFWNSQQNYFLVYLK